MRLGVATICPHIYFEGRWWSYEPLVLELNVWNELFDRFARCPESRGREDGSGLGLSIAQAYARAHGGEIVYGPAMPHGARFEVVIPLRGDRGDQRPGDARATRLRLVRGRLVDG